MFGLNWNYGDLLDLQLGILVLGADHKDHKVHVFGNCSKCGKVGFKRLKVLGSWGIFFSRKSLDEVSMSWVKI